MYGKLGSLAVVNGAVLPATGVGVLGMVVLGTTLVMLGTAVASLVPRRHAIRMHAGA